jgi:TatD DNase family protein
MPSLPPLDLHAHAAEIGAESIEPGSQVFGQTMTLEEWDAQMKRPPVAGLVWGLGLHPIYTKSLADLDGFMARLPSCAAVGEIGLDYTGLSPVSPEDQKTILAAILSHEETQKRLLSVHALMAFPDVVAMLADHPTPGAIIHWYSAAGEPLRRAVEIGLFMSVNSAIVANPDHAGVLAEIPRDRVLVETDSPYIDRNSGVPLNPWEDTVAERSAGRALNPGEVLPIERSLALVWGVEAEEVRIQVWRNYAQLEARIEMKPFHASEVLAAAGHTA